MSDRTPITEQDTPAQPSPYPPRQMEFATAKTNSTNRMGGKPSVALDKALYGEWPDYAERPFAWEQRMQAIFHGYLMKHGLAFRDNRVRIIKATFAYATEHEFMGNTRKCIQRFKREYRDYMREKDVAKQTKVEHAPIVQRPTEWDAFDKEDKAVTPDNKKAIDNLNASLDELTTPVWSAVDAPEEQQQMLAFKHFQRELLIIEPKANVAAHILKALHEPLGPHIEAHGIALTCGKLQDYLNSLTENERENGNTETGATHIAEPPPPQNGGEIPSVNQPSKKELVDMPESPIVVYPMQNGSIVYKGIRFSVTLRLGGSFDMVLSLMDEFVKHIELVDPSCRVTAQPENVVPMQQQTTSAPTLPPPAAAPAANAAGGPDSAGRVPGQTGLTTISGVKVVKDDGKTIIELWAGGQYAEHRLQKANEHTMIERLTDWSALEIGTKYPVSWIADWVVSSNRAKKGNQNYYLNVTGIRAAAQQNAA